MLCFKKWKTNSKCTNFCYIYAKKNVWRSLHCI